MMRYNFPADWNERLAHVCSLELVQGQEEMKRRSLCRLVAIVDSGNQTDGMEVSRMR